MTVNVSRIDEYHNFIRGVVPKPLGQIIEGFYYSLILFDIISVGAQAMYPNIIAQYACAVRPIGSIAWPLFSEDVLQYSADQCLGAMLEPSTSIIFLSIKFSVGILNCTDSLHFCRLSAPRALGSD
jgi:hypothetical protein